MKRRLHKALVVVILALVMILTAGLAACVTEEKPPEPKQYTVTVENGTGGGTFDEGTEITVTATVPQGKVFEAWQSEGTVISTANPYTFKVRKNITLTAVFADDGQQTEDPGEDPDEPDKELEPLEDEVYYTVVADGGKIDGEDINSKQVASGTEVTLSAVVPEFFDFVCWNKDGAEFTTEEIFTYKVTSNVKFSTVINAVSRYTITHENCTSESIYQAGTEVVTVTADTRENYEFVNWTINGETVEAPAIYEFELTQDTTVIANYRRINITAEVFSSDEIIEVTLTSDMADPETGLFVEGDEITVEAKLVNGISLIGWRDQNGTLVSRDNPYTFTVTDDITLTAEIGPRYSVKVNGGTLVGTEGETSGIFGEGANCNVEATIGENQIFVNWTDAEGTVISTSNPYVFKVTKDIELTANLEEVAPGKTYVFEAENADLTKLVNNVGGTNCVESHENDDHADPVLNVANACSNGWIASAFNQTIGNTITWNIRSDSYADAVLVLRMCSGAWVSDTVSADINLSPENVDFLVNGQQLDYGPIFIEGRTALPGASHVSVFGLMSDYTISMRIQLVEGMNEIKMVLRETGSGPNIDALKLTTSANLTWTPVVNSDAPIAAYEYNVEDVWQGELPQTTYIFEAENADLSACYKLDGTTGWTEYHGGDDHGSDMLNAAHSCSNDWIAAGFNHTLDNTITWRINSDRDATAILLMRMCSGVWSSEEVSLNCELNPENVEYSVNGEPLDYEPVLLSGITAAEGASSLSAYGYMSDYVVAYNIQLKEGVNEISMKLLALDAGPNIDALKIRTSAKLTWRPTQNGDAPIANYGYNVYGEGEQITYVFEAENADLSKVLNKDGVAGDAVEKWEGIDHGDATLNQTSVSSNGWAAKNLNEQLGNTITWVIFNNSDTVADATFVLRCANGNWVADDTTGDIDVNPSRLEMSLNGQALDYAPFVVKGHTRLPGASTTSQYGLFSDYTIEVAVTLQPGRNEISIKLLERGAGPNVDALKVVTIAPLTWIPTQNGSAPIADYGYNVTA